ncbi:AraC family ligand binding domain-containing protein [Aquitalea magnusonii]|uniref:AraC family ligand binding domain-containing protein n=1 Tax=Aquitalea magnusonii TaxID=332411 RepID=UPI0019596C74|nr:AraC family ligand binding domain-containing protein [Aquitalea magnusonii]
MPWQPPLGLAATVRHGYSRWMIFLRTPLLELAGIQATAAGFPKHTHDEYVISVNLGGLEQVWLDGSSFEVKPDMLTIYPRRRCRQPQPERRGLAMPVAVCGAGGLPRLFRLSAA